MAKKKYQAIEEMIAFKKTERLTTANIKALREQFVNDMQALYKEKGWSIGTDQLYEGETVRLYEERSYTWETNHHIDSELRALYCSYKAQEAWLSKQLSQARKDVRSTAKKIESMYPDSESIKRTVCAQIRWTRITSSTNPTSTGIRLSNAMTGRKKKGNKRKEAKEKKKKKKQASMQAIYNYGIW